MFCNPIPVAGNFDTAPGGVTDCAPPPPYPPAPPPACSPGCPDMWIGDGGCDSLCNTVSCGFDGGDCVGQPAFPDNDLCQCIFYPPPPAPAPYCAPGCPPNWQGDGGCDSACNNAACNYDSATPGAQPGDGDCAAGTAYCAPGCPPQ